MFVCQNRSVVMFMIWNNIVVDYMDLHRGTSSIALLSVLNRWHRPTSDPYLVTALLVSVICDLDTYIRSVNAHQHKQVQQRRAHADLNYTLC